jgi:hypothetical protein
MVHRLSIPWHAAGLLALGLILLAPGQAAVAAEAPAARFCAGRDVALAPGDGRSLQLARRWQPVAQWQFDRGLSGWQVKNYDNGLSIENVDGALLVHRDQRETDTAFELASPPIALVAGSRHRLTIVAAHTLDLAMADGHNGSFLNQVRWLDREGHAVGATPFRFAAPSDSWYEVTLEARPPQGAVSAVVQIGFDSPNLSGERQFRLQRVAWTAQPDPPQYVAEGEMVSRPQRLAVPSRQASISWQAVAPEGTSVKFQVRSAADLDGGPRDWTPFAGPDGTTGSCFTANGAALPAIHAGHDWFQYRLVLGTTRADVTPVVQQVRLGDDLRGIEDRGWTGPDGEPPRLADYAPQRTSDPRQPLVFALADGPDGVGVDRHSLEVLLDGVPITAQVKHVEGKFRYELREPLKPLYTLASLEDWSMANYNAALTIRRRPPRAPGGGGSVELRRYGAKVDTALALVSPVFSVQEGATYQVAVWSRHTMDLRQAGGKGDSQSAIVWRDGQGNPLGNPVSLDLGGPSPEWRRTHLQVAAPPGARSATLRLGWDYPDIVAGDEVAFADPVFEGPHPEAGPRLNVHRVTVVARDFAGNVCQQPWWILVEPPPAAGVTTVRDDGVILVDGKPLFPLGLYAVWKREHNGRDFDRCFTELREAKFNTIHTYQMERNAELQEFYAAADRHGLRVIIAPRGGANSRDPQAAVRTVVEECRQPALLAWYLADDTASHISADELRRVHRAIREVDPFHVTVQADGVATGQPGRSRYTDYVESTDAFLPEIYPIRSNESCEVADVIRDMKLIGEDLRRAGRRAPVWAIIQDFEGWGWKRYPTEAETRVMTYLAIIHGATGMTYYTYGGSGANHGVTHDPQVWAALKRIARQLADLHEVLVERDPPQGQQIEILSGPRSDGLGYPAISARLKQHEGKHYLLTANSARGAVRAKIVAGAEAKQVEVLFEDRQLTPKSGVWEDEFAPYAVHVYRW